MPKLESVYFAQIVGLDVLGYSSRDPHDMSNIVEKTDIFIERALRAIDFEQPDYEWLDGGDGGFLLLVGDVRIPLAFAEEFLARLSRDNQTRKPNDVVHYRIAIHQGLVEKSTKNVGRSRGQKQRFTSESINDCARILSGMEQDVPELVVCSSEYKDTVCKFDKSYSSRFSNDRKFKDKRDREHTIWTVIGTRLVEEPPDKGVHTHNP